MHILVASPVRKPAAVVRSFVEGLNGLERKDHDLDFAFIDDNDDAEASEALGGLLAPRTVRVAGKDLNRPEFRTEATRLWTDAAVDRVAMFREEFLERAQAGGYDALMMVDADLVLKPETLRVLVECEKDIVSEVFWTRWRPELPELPNVWESDHYTLSNGFLDRLRTPGLYRVGGLGACTLIGRRALDAGVSYRRLYNLTWWGEDRHFCVRAVALGLELWADTRCAPEHLYR